MSRGLLASFLVGLVIVVGTYRLSGLLSSMESTWPWIFGAGGFGIFAAAIPFLFPKSSWLCIPLLMGAIPVGVFIDAVYDGAVNSVDRNLFPFEIIIWWAFTIIPVILGYLGGHAYAAKYRKPAL